MEMEIQIQDKTVTFHPVVMQQGRAQQFPLPNIWFFDFDKLIIYVVTCTYKTYM